MFCRRNLPILVAGFLAFPVAGIQAQEAEEAKPDPKPDAETEKPEKKTPVVEDINAVIKTSKGDIKIVLYAAQAPLTAANFLNLAKRDYYDNLLFHRVSPGFVVQAGDPLTVDPKHEENWGKGGPGYYIELETNPNLTHHGAGVLSMARKLESVDTAGSQFFITLDAQPHLDGKFAVFGEVTEGIEVVHEIAAGDKILDVEVLDSTDLLFAQMERRIAEWNVKLEQRVEAQKRAAEEAVVAEAEAEAKMKAAADAAAAEAKAKPKAKAEPDPAADGKPKAEPESGN